MFSRAIICILLVASVALSEPCKAQVKQFGKTDVTVSTGGKDGKDPKIITVLRQDFCTYPFYLQGTLAKSLSPGEPVKVEPCEMYWCTNRILLDECPGRVPENFKVTCKEATATLTKDGSSVSITFRYLKEKWAGKPVCKQWSSKEASEPKTITIPMGSTPPASGQSSSQGSSEGPGIGSKLNCLARTIAPGHPLSDECR